MGKIRWGIAGPGNIAHKFAKAIKNVHEAELVAVASRTEEKGKKFAEEYGIGHIFSGYEKMAESELVDAVYIATPHPFHKNCAELFLNAKKHVLCEKPICINANQAVELKKCAERNNVFLMEAMWTRFLPAISKARKIIERGDIGIVTEIKADFCYASSHGSEYKIFDNKMAGGSLLDVGVYGLHFASIFIGNNPEEIKAFSHLINEVDHRSDIMMKYKNGQIATISSAISLFKPRTAYIYGTNGYMCLPNFYGAKEIELYTEDGHKHIEAPTIGDGFEEEIIEACRCIYEGRNESDVLPMGESIAILKIMDTIRSQVNLRYPYCGDEMLLRN